MSVFRQIFETGVYHQIEWFYMRQEHSGIRLRFTRSNVKTGYAPVKPLNIYSNVQTIFYLYLCGIAVALFVGFYKYLHSFIFRLGVFQKFKNPLLTFLWFVFKKLKDNIILLWYKCWFGYLPGTNFIDVSQKNNLLSEQIKLGVHPSY